MTLSVAEILGDSDTLNMTEAMSRHSFSLSEVSELDSDTKVQCDSDPFDTMMLFEDVCSPDVMDISMETSLKEQLQDISCQNEVTPDEAITIPFSVTGIEANDVGSLFQQFMEYEQASASDPEVLSYPNSSVMSPADSPGSQNEDSVLGRLICVQEKLSREVASEELPNVLPPLENLSNENSIDDKLVMNIPNENKLLKSISDIHQKGNLARMADSPKFAKFKKKRLNNDPPLRITSSLPNTPGSTSPVSSEERKHMEIKLIEALALPVPKPNSKNNKNKKSSKDNDNAKKKAPAACAKRKQVPAEPIPSRLLPVVSKRQRNNLEKNKIVKDPRLESSFGNKDPRLNKADYGAKSNVIQLQSTNLVEINSSTNTASETVDDVCIIDMTIDHEKLPETLIMMSNKNDTAANDRIQVKPVGIETSDSFSLIQKGTSNAATIQHGIAEDDKVTPIPTSTCDSVTVIENGVCGNVNDFNSELTVCSDIEIKELSEKTDSPDQSSNNCILQVAAEEIVVTSGLIKPEKHYRKPGLENLLGDVNGAYSSASEHECDDDDRAYNRKKSKKSSPKPKKCFSSNIHSKRSSSCSRSESSYSRSNSRTPSNPNSRCSSRQEWRSPPRKRSRSRRRYRSKSPHQKVKSDRRFSESSYSSPERSDTDDMDISNKLIELSNPVPYDIEHERKLKFLSGGASKGMGERKNIYAGGISNNTTRGELAERFRRFGQITKITLHFRDKGDNYAFIVFEQSDDALRAIEEGNDDPKYPTLDLCFGGRRKFVGGSYVDFDGNNRYLEESDKAVNNRCDSPGDDFDRLLQMAMKDTKKRQSSPTRNVKKEAFTPDLTNIKKEPSPEWT